MTKVLMKSPEGEVKEVDATPEVLVPLMVAGYQQVKQPVQPEGEDHESREIN